MSASVRDYSILLTDLCDRRSAAVRATIRWLWATLDTMWFRCRLPFFRRRGGVLALVVRLMIVVFICLVLFSIFNYSSRCRYEMPTVFADPVFLHSDTSHCRINLDSLGQYLASFLVICSSVDDDHDDNLFANAPIRCAVIIAIAIARIHPVHLIKQTRRCRSQAKRLA